MPAVLSSAAALAGRAEAEAADCGLLLELFELVPDPRRPRGIRHSLPAVLGLAVAAVLAGCRSVLAIAEWAAEAPQPVLAALGARLDARTGCRRAPGEDTFRRVLGAVDPAAVDQVVGIFLTEHAGPGAPGRGWRPQPGPDGPASQPEEEDRDGPASQPEEEEDRDGPASQPEEEDRKGAGPGGKRAALAVDGKTVRGARRPGGRALHLLAAVPHDVPAVLAQREVGPKTNEITQVKPLLEHLDLAGRVVTLDALHCQRATARHLAGDRHADYVFTAVKANQAGLMARLRALPWDQAPAGHASSDRGHGRQETRTLQALPVPRGLFPRAAQAFLIRRQVHDLRGAPVRAAASVGLTSLPPAAAGPAELAGYVRGHWAIENKLHWVRDTAFAEDHAQLRAGSAPHVLAALRNLAIGALHAAGHHKITAALRWVSRDPIRVLAILSEPP